MDQKVKERCFVIIVQLVGKSLVACFIGCAACTCVRARWLFTQRPVTPCFCDTSSPAEGRGSKHRPGSGRWKQTRPWSKGRGAALWAAAATVFVCSWGSKLVTVSFHLWRWSSSSRWEEGPPCWVGRGRQSLSRSGEDGWKESVLPQSMSYDGSASEPLTLTHLSASQLDLGCLFLQMFSPQESGTCLQLSLFTRPQNTDLFKTIVLIIKHACM